jgi:hypothetical protein
MATKPVQTCSAVLSSGRVLKIRKPTTSMVLDVAERFSEGSAKFAKAILAKAILAITRLPVPEKRDNKEIVDEEAMVASVAEGAGGGWMTVSEQDMATADGDRSFAALFDDEPLDFRDATRLIMEAMRPPTRGAATTGRIVRSVDQ